MGEKQSKLKFSEEEYKANVACYNIFYPEEDFFPFIVKDTFDENKKIKLYTYRFPPSVEYSSPQGIIYFFHGHAAHQGHLAHIAKIFSENGYLCVGYDARGFGKSEGDRGCFTSFETSINDAVLFMTELEKFIPSDSPLNPKNIKTKIAFGESMGGLLVASLLCDYESLLSGSIMIAPALGLNQSIPKFLQNMVAGMSKKKPKWKLPKLRPMYTRNKYIIDYDKHDPNKEQGGIRLCATISMYDQMKKLEKSCQKISLPYLIIQGEKDRVVNPKTCHKFELQTNSTNTKVIIVPKGEHDLPRNPTTVDLVIKESLDFLKNLS